MRISDWSSDVCSSDLGPRFWEIKTNLTGLYADMTVDFVVHNSQKPWFVNLWLNDIHDPWAPDDESLSDVMGKGESSEDDRTLASLVKMDKTPGRFFDRLDQMGEMDNRSDETTSEPQALMPPSHAGP